MSVNAKAFLMPKSDFKTDITDEQVENARIALMQGSTSSQNIEVLRKKLEEKKKAIQVIADENKAASSMRIANALTAIDDALFDDEVLCAVKQGIIESKDPAKSYLDFSKAANELQKRLDSQLDGEFSPNALLSGKKNAKIQLAFGNGNLALAVDMGDDK